MTAQPIITQLVTAQLVTPLRQPEQAPYIEPSGGAGARVGAAGLRLAELWAGSHTIFHTQLCHTTFFTHHFVTHHFVTHHL